MKLLGAAMLTAAGLLGGISASRRLSARLALCRSLCQMLRLMAFSLERFLTPLPELFDALSGQLSGEAGRLCRKAAGMLAAGGGSFSSVWTQALASLPRREREILLPLGQVLGRYGAGEQTEAVRASLGDMTALCGELGGEYRDRSRVYIGVFTAGGLMLAVLLM